MTADCGWLWLFAGAALMLLELVTPGFVLFFFGLAAATVGGIRLAVGEAFTLAAQLAAFSALSVVYLVALRRFVTRLFADGAHAARPDIDNEYVGRVGRVTAAVAPAHDPPLFFEARLSCATSPDSAGFTFAFSTIASTCFASMRVAR